MDPTTILAAVLGIVALGAGVFAFAGGGSGGATVDRKTAKRVTAVAGRPTAARRGSASAADPADRRRKQVADTLKELERKAKAQKARPTLRQMIEQAGFDTPIARFWMYSAVTAVVTAALAYLQFRSPYVALAAGFAGGLGLPRWYLGFRKKRRQKQFLVEFANSIDVIVRGVKSGLPLNDCLRMIGQEAPDPVGFEFRSIIENQRVGLTLDECLSRFYARMPLAEVNFFQIVLSIQQRSGGNLSEALSNLSNVLRERKRLQGKIKALSSEAKTSAGIIGCLPVFVMIAVTVISPGYTDELFNTRTGNILLAGCAMWMGLGIFMMKKMIDFRY